MANTIDWQRFRGVAADLDGVVTQTAAIHKRAWKQMFDEFLKLRERRGENAFKAFDEEEDYPALLDGVPRLDGIRAFLQSRELELPEGTQGDTLDDETIVGLGSRKNEIYRSKLESQSVPVWRPAVRCLRRMRTQGLRLCVISSSRNCPYVLEAAGLDHLFDARVDGNWLAEEDKPGKPEPDMFLQAARELGIEPNDAIAFEDAAPGVKAAKAANYGLVVGVNRAGVANELSENSADIVVDSFEEIMPEPPQESRKIGRLPSALESLDEIRERLFEHQVAVFCDYDGTLTPIVEHPEDAELSSEMRSVLTRLSEKLPAAIVSGRDRRDIEERVDVEGLWYAGSHGFDLITASGEEMTSETGDRYLPALDQAEQILRQRLSSIDGAQVERKRFAIAVHYRRVNPDARSRVLEKTLECGDESESLRVQEGNMVVELRPDAEWDKGRAVEWMLDRMGLNASEDLPIYIGDDVTDRDAFRTVNRLGGISIVVGEALDEARADYRLSDSREVRSFLNKLLNDSEDGP